MDRSCQSNVCFVVLTILLMRAQAVIAFLLSLLAACLGKSSNLYLCVSFMYVCHCVRIFVYVMRLYMLYIIFNKNIKRISSRDNIFGWNLYVLLHGSLRKLRD